MLVVTTKLPQLTPDGTRCFPMSDFGHFRTTEFNTIRRATVMYHIARR